MDPYTSEFWRKHAVESDYVSTECQPNTIEWAILGEFRGLSGTVGVSAPATTKTTKTHLRRKFAAANVVQDMNTEDVHYYSDDSDYDDDDIKQYLYAHFPAARRRNAGKDDERDDEIIVPAPLAPAPVQAAAPMRAPGNPAAVQARVYDFWHIVSTFVRGGVAVADAQVCATVDALPEKERFCEEYRILYRTAKETLAADQFKERNAGMRYRGIINYMIYMGEDSFNTLLNDLDFLQMTIDCGECFFPQVKF